MEESIEFMGLPTVGFIMSGNKLSKEAKFENKVNTILEDNLFKTQILRLFSTQTLIVTVKYLTNLYTSEIQSFTFRCLILKPGEASLFDMKNSFEKVLGSWVGYLVFKLG